MFEYRKRKIKEGIVDGSNEVFSCDVGGNIILYESESQVSDAKILGSIRTAQPYGLIYVKQEGLYFTNGQTCSSDGERSSEQITRMNLDGRVDLELASPFFSNLHCLDRTEKGLLFTSTGLDAIFEIDFTGEIFWECWEVNHVYDTLKSGKKRNLNKSQDHRAKCYPTLAQTVHLTQAIIDPHNNERILALLYHQGEIIEIDRTTSETRVLLSGLRKPHHVRKTLNGYLLTNTANSEILLLDRDFKTVQSIGRKLGRYELSNWVQDAAMTERGTYLVGDEGNFRLIEVNQDLSSTDAFYYGEPSRMFHIHLLPESFEVKLNGTIDYN